MPEKSLTFDQPPADGETGFAVTRETKYIRADLVAPLVEALHLADAALSGSNMNMNVVDKKVKQALAQFEKGGVA